MLNIVIDGKRAALKKGTAFDLVSENRRFGKSDSYTLEIAFPLKDCKQNCKIFGLLNRKDADIEKLIYDCQIIDKGLNKHGSLIITEISEIDVKCQFLEGRSGAKLTSPLADKYINDLKIKAPNTSLTVISPVQAWSPDQECVALPWVNNESGNIQNKITYENSFYKWADDIAGLSWMPYLTTVIKGICTAIGYSCDVSAIENNPGLKYLLVCNVLPYTWFLPDVARALPHWTIEEFFGFLEDFLLAKVDIDHVAKHIKIVGAESLYAESQSGIVEITSDINDFTVDVFVNDSDCSAIDVQNIKYKKSDHQHQNFYDCNWAVKRLIDADMVLYYDTLDELISDVMSGFQFIDDAGHRNLNLTKLYYVDQYKKYFCTRCWSYDSETKKRFLGLQVVNEYGARIIDESEEAKSTELMFVPACVDFTELDFGFTLFMSPGSYGESSQSNYDAIDSSDISSVEGETGNHRGSGGIHEVLKEGEFSMQRSEYYDRIYFAWWDGEIEIPKTNPFPAVSKIFAGSVGHKKVYPFDFSLKSENSVFSKFAFDIDPSARYNIAFLADSLPDVNKIYLIRGKKYVCEKLTVSMTDKGMSSLIKGVFWRLN